MIVVGYDLGGKDRTTLVFCERQEDGSLRVLETLEVEGEPAPVHRVTLGSVSHHVVLPAALYLERNLRRKGVSASIIERVVRLNPSYENYEIPKGLHHKPGRWWGLPRGLMQKGVAIRTYGREAFDRVPKDRLVKDGRRVWVSYRDMEAAARVAVEVIQSSNPIVFSDGD